jgi:hypothetical protein
VGILQNWSYTEVEHLTKSQSQIELGLHFSNFPHCVDHFAILISPIFFCPKGASVHLVIMVRIVVAPFTLELLLPARFQVLFHALAGLVVFLLLLVSPISRLPC